MNLFGLLGKKTPEIDKKQQKQYDWCAEQFKIINIIQSRDEVTKCKICDVKMKGLVVKVENLYAYLPFQLAPWLYPSTEYWATIIKSLRNRYFDCKIASAEKIDDGKFKIFVDASVHQFRTCELKRDYKFAGIILKKTENGLFVEIGGHFAWKFGSIHGFLNNAKHEDLKNYSEGDNIDVYFWDKTVRGIDFVNSKFYDIYKEYIGKRASLLVMRDNDEEVKLLVEGKFDAFCVDKITENIVNQLDDYEIIECEIVGYNSQTGFAMKHIYHDSTEHINWTSFILQKYIGRADLTIGQKYNGIVVKKFRNGVFVDIGQHFDWELGSIIGRMNKEHFENINTFNNLAVGSEIPVIYAVQGIEQALSFYEVNFAEITDRYVGKILPVSIYIIADTLTLLLEDRFKATPHKKRTEENILCKYKNGDTIYCEVLKYTPFKGYVVRYLQYENN
jgi:ribosomal protein S1